MAREKKPKVGKRPDGRYLVRYKGKTFYSTISSDDAYAKRDEYIRKEQAGLTKKATVSEYGLPWLKRTYPAVADSTYAGLAIHLQHLIDTIGNKQISTVLPSDIKQVYADHYKTLSNSYINGAKQLYCALFDSAVADGYCRSNPARDRTAKPHKGTKPKEKELTKQQRTWIETLCTDHRAYPLVMTMLYTGMRPQEAKAFNIDRDVDFDNNIVTVQETAHLDGQKYEFTEEMKTDWSKRQIPLFLPLREVLYGRHGNLITSADGEPVTIQTYKTAFESYLFCMETAINGIQKRWYGRTKVQKKLKDEGKLPPWIEFKITSYTLRHAFCSMICRDNGVELNVCRRWMGHADAKMILKVYDTVSKDRSETERKKVENSLIGSQNGSQSQNEKPEPVDK